MTNCEVKEVTIYKSILDKVHNCGNKIIEFYIPEMDLAINVVDETLHCFKPDPVRYKDGDGRTIQNLTLSTKTLKEIADYYYSKKQLELLFTELANNAPPD